MRGLKFHPSDEDLSPGTPVHPRLPPDRVSACPINHLRRTRAHLPHSFDTLEIRTLLTAFRIHIGMRAFLGRSTSLRVERP
jgi:hypothetical protein